MRAKLREARRKNRYQFERSATSLDKDKTLNTSFSTGRHAQDSWAKEDTETIRATVTCGSAGTLNSRSDLEFCIQAYARTEFNPNIARPC